jgi:DNA repair protein RecN (Recombination protein N)
LDIYGDIQGDAYRESYREWRAQLDKLQQLKETMKGDSQQRQFLEFQLVEIQKYNLKDGELQELEEEHQLLANSVDIETNVRALSVSGEDFSSRLLQPLEQLESLLQHHPDFAALLGEGRSLQISAEEWARTLRSTFSEMEADPGRLMEVESRLADLRAITKKFQMEESELIAHQKSLEDQLSGPPLEVELEQLEQDVENLNQQAMAHAKKLDKARVKAAKKLSKEINALLSSLEMDGERFSIQMNCTEELGPKGISKIEFMLKPTADGPAMSLAECASGGERSRALLSISSALSQSMGVGLLVFDEIDTNIGSRLGRPISEAFLKLSDATQVICVTHLAPVAACGEKHFIVEKGSQSSEARELTESERLSELAQMIAGEKNSAAALEQAEHMLKQYRGRA